MVFCLYIFYLKIRDKYLFVILIIGVFGVFIGIMFFLLLINFLYVFLRYVLFFRFGMKKNVLKYRKRKVINININIYFFLSLRFDLLMGIG